MKKFFNSIVLGLFLCPLLAVSAQARPEHRPSHHHRGAPLVTRLAPHHRTISWHKGHWSHGRYGRQTGWWWIVGGTRYFYSQPIYPYPDMYRPLYVVQQPALQTVSFPPPTTAQQVSLTYIDAQGRSCREYQTTISVDGLPQPAYGTACLYPDGAWRVVK